MENTPTVNVKVCGLAGVAGRKHPLVVRKIGVYRIEQDNILTVSSPNIRFGLAQTDNDFSYYPVYVHLPIEEARQFANAILKLVENK